MGKSIQTKLHFATDDHVSKGNIYSVPHSQLTVLDGFNDRTDYGTTEEMNELAESIYHQGPRVALRGYKKGDKYVVIVGHRRFRAGEMIKKKYNVDILFQMQMYLPGTPEKDMLLDTLLTNSGKDLTPLEKASAVAKLIELQVPTKEIASNLGGVSEVYVKNLNKLWSIPDTAKKLIRDGVVSSSLIMGVLKNKNANFEEWLQDIEKQAAGLEKKNSSTKGGKKKAAKITAKNAPDSGKKLDSIKEFKKFRKNDPGNFENKAKQAFFELLSAIADNKATLLSIQEFFTGK